MRLVTAILLSAPLFGADYTIDPARSSAGFSIKNMVVNTVNGQFSKVTGTIRYDAGNLAAANVEATIDASTINTEDAKRDRHLKSADFFDVATYPTLTFRSSKWSPGGKLAVAGNLTIHGVTKPVVLTLAELPSETAAPTGGKQVSATATTKINRKDFGLTWHKLMDTGGAVVGEEVAITIRVVGTRK